MKLLDLLQNPSDEFTPIPFWFLNGYLTHKELRRQLGDFVEHGVHGVVVHPRMGISKHIVYLSDTYFKYIETIIQTADSLGMKIVLYDEGMYPSGSANGQIVREEPQLASEGILLTRDIKDKDEVLAETEKGFLVVRKSGGTLRGIHWGEDDGEPNAPLTADILNPVAVDKFISLTHEAYYQRFKKFFGNTIIGFFTDEPSILGRNVEGMFPWTHKFAKEFTLAGGNLKNLSALFYGETNNDTELYHNMILQKECDVYYGKLSAWCEKHGIALMGHPHQSDDIEVQRYFHVPGQDLVLRWLAPEKSGIEGIDSTMAKCSADAARIMDRRRNANEVFGACNKDNNPWYFTGGDMKWYLDWLAVRGVNMYIPHAFYYSIAGKRKEERPPDVGPNNIWWPYYRLWSDYMKRLACLMTDTELITSVAVLCRNRNLYPEEVAALYQNQISFQYLPESVWKDCVVDRTNGELIYKEQKFRIILGAENSLFSDLCNNIEKAKKDCDCTPCAPMLRCAHFKRENTECWFLVNEGNQTIQTTLTLFGADKLGNYDLWNNKAYKQVSYLTEAGLNTEIILKRRESILLFSCNTEEYDALDMPMPKILLKPSFKLIKEDKTDYKKMYFASIETTSEMINKEIVLEIDGEDMAELSVNGVMLPVSFWSPHSFILNDVLQEGNNELILTMTGSLANRYGYPVAYGIESLHL